jgi:hypothetical protein
MRCIATGSGCGLLDTELDRKIELLLAAACWLLVVGLIAGIIGVTFR